MKIRGSGDQSYNLENYEHDFLLFTNFSGSVLLIEPFGSHRYFPIQHEPCPQGF